MKTSLNSILNRFIITLFLAFSIGISANGVSSVASISTRTIPKKDSTNRLQSVKDEIRTEQSAAVESIRKIRKGRKGRKKRTRKKRKSVRRSSGGTINLESLDSSTSSRSRSSSSRGSSKSRGRRGGQSFEPQFKMMFDLYLHSRPGISDLTFQSFHGLMLVEYVPSPDLKFEFEINPAPRYYELDWEISNKLQLRVGRIWVPFDDINPHNNFGGRVNTSPLNQGSQPFLPDVWAELGVAAKYQLMDSSILSMEAHAYILNGFQASGNNPVSGEETIPYPGFAGVPPGLPSQVDNNTDKALGGRISATLYNRYSLGASVYTARYTDDSDESARILMYGVDTQIRFGPTTLKAGYINMNVGLIPPSVRDSFVRGGLYAEGKFRVTNQITLVARTGLSQVDNRVVSKSDQQIVGGEARYNFGAFSLGLIHNRDLNVVEEKVNYTFTALRFRMIL